MENTVENVKLNMFEKLGVTLGTGACRVLNTIREKSNAYDKAYYTDPRMQSSLMASAMFVANRVGRTGVSIIKEMTGVTADVFKDSMTEIKKVNTELKEINNNLYSDYKNMIKTSQAQLQDMRDGEVSVGTRFKSFMVNMAASINDAYDKTHDFRIKAADNIKTFAGNIKESFAKQGGEIKKSSAYQQLMSAKAKSEAEDTEKSEAEASI